MPLYTYQCTNCNHRATELRKVAQAQPRIECPRCERMDYTKQVDAPQPPILKGGGYYATDFKHK